jgi:hypothetical protein
MRCANCSAELAPEHRFCEVCGAVRPSFPQRIAESEREFQLLRDRHHSGQLDEAALSAELKRLVVHDEETGYWMLGARTGRWYWFDGQQWVLREPPSSEALPVQEDLSQALADQPLQQTVAQPSPGAQATPVTAEPASIVEAISAGPARVQTQAGNAMLQTLQRMLFVAAAGTLGALLGVLLAYVVGFFCGADTPAGHLACVFAQFAFLGVGLGLALGLGCGLLLGADVRGAGLGIPLGGLGGLTGGILLMAVRLTLLGTGQGAEEADPGLLAQALPLLVYGLAFALMIGLLPGLLTRSPSRAISGVVWCGVAAAAVLMLVLVVRGIGFASLSQALWTGYPLGIPGGSGRLASTAWPALFLGSILGAALGYTSLTD